MRRRISTLRATVIIEVILICAGLGGAAGLAGWKPSLWFKKKPPTEQVTKLQADLAKAQVDLETARQAAAAADAAELAKKDEQTRAGQQMAEGAYAALTRIPADHRTPESLLARDLLARANIRLAAAIGALPADQQAEILRIVDQALSNVQADRAAAAAALAAKDTELKQVTLEREQIKAQLPILAAQLNTKDATVRAVQAEFTVAVTKVNTFAAEADAKDRKNGSLTASLERLLFWAAIIIGTYLFLAYAVPVILKFMRPGKTKTILRNVSGYLTGGLHFHDAKKKLAEAQPTP